MRYKLTFVVGLALGYVVGTRAGRERYEQMKKSARDFAQNPAVRNAAESAAQTGRQVAGKAMHAVSDTVGDRLPSSVTDRVHALRDRRRSNGRVEDDDWGTSNT
ncbi:YtxH domain-containing protein [Streptomyces sp. NBC_01255]|uniref:YtxH domain-containing protein n=1 Tax=Streptomyces sp. NBC_01255 TaxID=2903798 RepID=UPI002E349740|nr:YtxH domain-containing protein [Streptomyces sp. NBC_01255]